MKLVTITVILSVMCLINACSDDKKSSKKETDLNNSTTTISIANDSEQKEEYLEKCNSENGSVAMSKEILAQYCDCSYEAISKDSKATVESVNEAVQVCLNKASNGSNTVVVEEI